MRYDRELVDDISFVLFILSIFLLLFMVGRPRNHCTVFEVRDGKMVCVEMVGSK